MSTDNLYTAKETLRNTLSEYNRSINKTPKFYRNSFIQNYIYVSIFLQIVVLYTSPIYCLFFNDNKVLTTLSLHSSFILPILFVGTLIMMLILGRLLYIGFGIDFNNYIVTRLDYRGCNSFTIYDTIEGPGIEDYLEFIFIIIYLSLAYFSFFKAILESMTAGELAFCIIQLIIALSLAFLIRFSLNKKIVNDFFYFISSNFFVFFLGILTLSSAFCYMYFRMFEVPYHVSVSESALREFRLSFAFTFVLSLFLNYMFFRILLRTNLSDTWACLYRFKPSITAYKHEYANFIRTTHSKDLIPKKYLYDYDAMNVFYLAFANGQADNLDKAIFLYEHYYDTLSFFKKFKVKRQRRILKILLSTNKL